MQQPDWWQEQRTTFLLFLPYCIGSWLNLKLILRFFYLCIMYCTKCLLTISVISFSCICPLSSFVYMFFIHIVNLREIRLLLYLPLSSGTVIRVSRNIERLWSYSWDLFLFFSLSLIWIIMYCCYCWFNVIVFLYSYSIFSIV